VEGAASFDSDMIQKFRRLFWISFFLLQMLFEMLSMSQRVRHCRPPFLESIAIWDKRNKGFVGLAVVLST
jgi:hypothetical protein